MSDAPPIPAADWNPNPMFDGETEMSEPPPIPPEPDASPSAQRASRFGMRASEIRLTPTSESTSSGLNNPTPQGVVGMSCLERFCGDACGSPFRVPDVDLPLSRRIFEYFILYLRYWPQHFLRSFSAVTEDLSSVEETNHLKRVFDPDQLKTSGTVNTIVWRRSTLVVLIFVGFLSMVFQIIAVQDSKAYYDQTVRQSQWNTTYGADPYDSASWRNYTTRVVTAAASSTVENVTLLFYVGDIVILLMTITSLAAAVAALSSWARYRWSRKAMLFAWLIAFIAPFCVSFVPARMLVDWSRFDTHSTNYIRGFAIHFQMDERAAKVVQGCNYAASPDRDADLEQKRQQLDNICENINDADGGFSGFLLDIFGKQEIVDEAKRNCALAQELANDGRVDEALETVRNNCLTAIDSIDKIRGGQAQDLSFIQQAVDLLSYAKEGAELLVGVFMALWAFKTLLPAAVALAPALLRGSLHIKVLVPQSSIPGMFIVCLPWLYCPLQWVIFNVAFQLIGDGWLFACIFLQVMAPMVYFIGGSYWHVTRPMDDVTMTRVINRLTGGSAALLLASVVCAGMYLYQGAHRTLVAEATEQFTSPRLVFSLLASTMRNYLLTTVAGVDFMLGEIAAQRSFEHYLESGHSVGMLKDAFSSAGDRLMIHRMMADRNARLDDLCVAVKKGLPSRK